MKKLKITKDIEVRLKKYKKEHRAYVKKELARNLKLNSITIKNMESGEQGKVPLNQAEERVKLLMEQVW